MNSAAWPTFLSFHGTTDGILRALSVIIAAIVIVKYGSLFEEEYSKKLIDLYVYPWWRFIIVFLLITSAAWCPRVGIVVAVVVFFYLSDMNTLITPLTNL